MNIENTNKHAPMSGEQAQQIFGEIVEHLKVTYGDYRADYVAGLAVAAGTYMQSIMCGGFDKAEPLIMADIEFGYRAYQKREQA